jgi:hypothetical protein
LFANDSAREEEGAAVLICGDLREEEEAIRNSVGHLPRCKRAATSGRRKMPPLKAENPGRRKGFLNRILYFPCAASRAT